MRRVDFAGLGALELCAAVVRPKVGDGNISASWYSAFIFLVAGAGGRATVVDPPRAVVKSMISPAFLDLVRCLLNHLLIHFDGL